MRGLPYGKLQVYAVRVKHRSCSPLLSFPLRATEWVVGCALGGGRGIPHRQFYNYCSSLRHIFVAFAKHHMRRGARGHHYVASCIFAAEGEP